MAFYLIVRSHYYGPKTGPWHLLVDTTGEPVVFASRKEAMAAIRSESLSHNEYACEFNVVSDGNCAGGRIERRRNDVLSGRSSVSKS